MRTCERCLAPISVERHRRRDTYGVLLCPDCQGWDNWNSNIERTPLVTARRRPTRPMRRYAHESEGSEVFHCPWCGSGQVIGRSDGSIECTYCDRIFTVKEEASESAMPQTIDGEPFEQDEDPNPSSEEEMASVVIEAPVSKDDDDKTAKRYRVMGGMVSEDAYVRHLALRHADDRSAVLRSIKRRR